ncbi:CRISPR-associated endoribonuclease Cas6 [Thermoflavimicrobium daqui]|uniref:CRISPR-associated endoribonuclease Cas6 n=1 Tax=Thermoflavimicrobium daqui TaxID=2137476 RepID=A0A364K7D5_9BACL|nr:CRISPR-associated endoribonuclease Cas6 [Thermoflavimicrobium daqui]RAL26188.1 CRISPR-associated endoribonuclease Cas6 [Thermoflavimicrobium daqui]
MRIKCSFICDEIPISYRMLFVSILKKCLEQANEEYFNQLYYYQKQHRNKRSKNFTFSVFLRDYQLDKEVFRLDQGEVEWFISSPDREFILYLYNGLQKNNSFNFQKYELHRKRIDLLPEKIINHSAIVCQTMSPIYIKNKDQQVLSPDQIEYHHELNYIANITLKNARGTGLKKELQFKPLDMKKIVSKEAIATFQKETNRPYLYVEAYKGQFQLQGDPEDLNMLYQTGLSFRRNAGYGMFEILST